MSWLEGAGHKVVTGTHMTLLKPHVQGLGRTLAVGYILYFWSERVFWSFWRPQDSPKDALVTWMVYSLLAAAMLTIVRTYAVSSFAPLFLAGAIYGWLAEGGVVATMYGDPGNPFPLSISWTGLAWHALISVCLGWWWVGLALASQDARAVAVRAAVLGAGAGAWAIWWQTQPDGRPPTTAAFAAHVATFSLGLAAAWWVLGRLPAPEGRPSRWGRAVLLSLSLAFLLCVRVPATPVAAAVLPPLLAACWLALRCSARQSEGPDVLAQTSGSFGARCSIALLALPASACAVYACLAWTRWPTNVALYLVTMPLGFWFLGGSLWKALRPARSPVTGDPP